MLPLALVTACVTPVTRMPPASAASGAPLVDALRERIATTIATRPGAEVAVYYQDLARPDSIRYNADLSFHAASTMKVPVMIELFRRVDSGTLSLDQTVAVVNRFPSMVDGTPFALDSAADSEVSLYRRVGGTATLGELPSPFAEIKGCPFYSRCAIRKPICATAAPELRAVAPGQAAACHLI